MKVAIAGILLLLIAGTVGSEPLPPEGYLSFSVRTPRQDPDTNPIDYELMLGIANIPFIERTDLKTERENGNHYKGWYLKTKPTKHPHTLLKEYSAEIEIDQARALNEQWIYRKLAGILGLDIRLSGRWDTWDFDTLMLGVSSKWNLWRNIHYEASLDTNFTDRTISRHNIYAQARLTRHIAQDLRLYRHIGAGQNHWQIKTAVRFKL